MKKFIAVFLCFVIISCSFCLSASATAVDSDMIAFGLDLLRVYYGMSDMSSDDFYSWYATNRGFDSDFWEDIYAAYYDAYNDNPYFWPYDGILKPLTVQAAISGAESIEGSYDVACLSKSMVDGLRFDAASYVSEIRYRPFSDFGITFNGHIVTDFFSVVGTPYFVSSDFSPSMVPGYVTCNRSWSSANISDDDMVLYSGSGSCPLFVVMPNADVYHHGHLLPKNYCYLVLDSHTVLQVNGTWCPPFLYWFDGENTNGRFFVTCLSRDDGVVYIDPETGLTSVRVHQVVKLFIDGVDCGSLDNAGLDHWQVYDLLEKMRGTVIGSAPADEPDDFTIPYDDKDHVIVLIPRDGGDVVYMSPTEYNNYVNNGQIVEGDYINNYSEENNTDITNNYNNYVINFDDSKILNKLDLIIGHLVDIKNNINVGLNSEIDIDLNIDKLFDDLISIDDVKFGNLIDKISMHFNFIDYDRIDQIVNPPPVYDEFSDIVATVPLIGEVRQIINDFRDCLLVPAADPEIDFELFGISSTITFDWYKSYQGNIKALLRVLAYLSGVISCWFSLKSAFGIHRGGDD